MDVGFNFHSFYETRLLSLIRSCYRDHLRYPFHEYISVCFPAYPEISVRLQEGSAGTAQKVSNFGAKSNARDHNRAAPAGPGKLS